MEKAIYCNMQRALRVRARLGVYDYSAKIMLKPKVLLRTKEGECSINFAPPPPHPGGGEWY